MIKNLPAVQEIQVQSLGGEDALEQGMRIHSSSLAWRIPWTEEPVDYSPWGRRESDTTEYIQTVLKRTPPSIPRTFPSSQILGPAARPGHPPLGLCELTHLGASYARDHMRFVLL